MWNLFSRWFNPRALALAVLLAIAAALPFVTTSVERREFYFFDITLTSTTAGSTQLFWDIGHGFNEYDSSRQPLKVERTPVNYRFMMPMGRINALRFDPVDGAGVFTFKHAQIVDAQGRIVKVFRPEDLRPAGGVLQAWNETLTRHVSTDPSSNDPVLTLHLDAPLELKPGASIRLRLGWLAAWPVLLLGTLLSLRPVAHKLTHATARLLAFAQPRPATSLLLAATVVVAIQCAPVIFQGRSFASPNNGGHMLYQGLPALPADTDDTSTNTGSSDTGALLFQHLYYPMVQRDALHAGEWPLWNRYSLCGEPLLGQGQSMFGDPFNFLTIAADGAGWAWDVRFVIARWLLAAALGGIVWQLTRHFGAALLTTLGAGFLGFFTYRLVHPANFSVCYAPLILFAWTGLLRADAPRRLIVWLAALVAANWLTMTSGTVKEAYMLMVGLNFAGVLLLLLRPECAGRRMLVLVAACGAGFGFVLLSAPLWISFLSAWGHSMTGYDTPHADTLRLAHVIGFFDDIFYRQTAKEENVVAPALNFLFLVGVLAWFVQPRRSGRDRTGWALVLAALPPFALAFGIVPPALIEKIPFVGNIVHVGNTFSCVLMPLVAVLGGLGFRDIWESTTRADGPAFHLRLWLALAALLALYFVTATSFDKSPFFTGYAPALVLAAAALPLGWQAARQERLSLAPLWVVLVLGVPLLLWRHSQYRESSFSHYTFVPGPRSNLHAVSPAITMLKASQNEPGRTNGWESVLYASYNTVPRLEGVYGVDAVRSRHYHDLADALGLERVWNWDWPNRESQSRELVRKYDLYNVTHWLATPTPGPHPIDGLTQIGRADLDVYASPTAWPRAFFVDRLTTYAQPADFARLLMSGDGRPLAAVQASDFTDKPPALPLSEPTTPREIRAARDYRFTPNTTAFTIDAPRAGLVVLTETYYFDDFKVTVNGQPAAYFRVNHAFKGVQLPAAGTYRIEFAYWPKHFTAALWCGLAGAVFLTLGVVRLSHVRFPDAAAPS
ncbi:MAG: hypothetical protein KF715_06960 [Candidatus Didemnitutus sp.]|nr:hypothetical protein [Candidatus Didemnitutus sp.]